MNKETTDHSEAQEIYNETSNTAAGINTHKNHGRSGPLDMVSGAVEEMVDEVRQTFEGDQQPDDKKPGSDTDK
jgi:hypothetical protein